MSERVGQKFGNYRLIRLLGEGGFAEVYLGEHIYLHTRAAIKILHTQLTGKEVELFYREARTVAHLVHSHIVRVLEFGTEGIVPFLVMDYAPNGTLRQRHPKGEPIRPLMIISYVRQLASALQYAHDNKVVHRDVKPENMLISQQNMILLSDFGVALVTQSSLQHSLNGMAGTIAYMAPEQLDGSPLPASDQYSLAVVVYEWLCGERPFHGTFIELAMKHKTIPPPSLRSRLPSLPPGVEKVVMTALSKDPRQRFTSMLEFALALERSLNAETMPYSGFSDLATAPDWQLPSSENVAVGLSTPRSSTDTPQIFNSEQTPASLGRSSDGGPLTPSDKVEIHSRPQRHVTRRAVVAGLVGLGIVGAGGTMFALAQKIQSTQAEPPKPKLGTTFVTYTGHIYPVYTAAWSNDGRFIASGGSDTTVQVWNAADGVQLHVYRGHSAAVGTVAWSPDRKQPRVIASSSADMTVQIWDTSSKETLLIYREQGAPITAMAWSPDGRSIASGDTRGIIRIWNASNGTVLHTHESRTRLWTLAWSPDGKYIASGGDSGIVEVWRTDTSQVLITYAGHEKKRFIKAVSWSPDGRWIASGSDDWTVHIWNSASVKTRTVYTGHFEVLNAVAWSPDGRYIASGSGDHTVQIWLPSSGQQLYSYRGHSLALHMNAWSPDSTRIASASDDTYVKIWQAV
jgi:eukaryotic-like serine/threonine-protein kinase